MNIVGARIKLLREAQGWTQEYLSERAGLSRSTLANYELGRREPDLSALQSIARALGTSVAYLIGEVNDPSPPASVNNASVPSPILDRIKELAASANVAFDNLLKVAEVTEADLAGLDPDDPDPHVLWPIAQVLNTSMSYLSGLTDRVKPIIGPGQALHDSRNLYRPDPELDPEDAWDLEQAYLLARKRREERKRKQGN